MNELTPTEIAFINECNDLTCRIACAHSNVVNHASIHFFGRIGGRAGAIQFMLHDKLRIGEYDFRTEEECLQHLRSLLSAAA